jgi:hypothetical protein
MEDFLRFEVVCHHNNGPIREAASQERGQKRMSRRVDSAARQNAPFLQTLRQGLHSGSCGYSSEQIACRCDCRILRQAGTRSQRFAEPSTAGAKQNRKWKFKISNLGKTPAHPALRKRNAGAKITETKSC